MYPDRRCRTCTDGNKETWGCTKPVRQPHVLPNDPAVGLCPLQTFRDQPELEGIAFALHMNWRKGHLPVAGGIDDQPHYFMAVISATEHGTKVGRVRQQEVQRQQAEKDARKGNRGKGGRR